METQPPESRDHYAYVTRMAIRLFNQGLLTNVFSIDIEPMYGYTTRLNYDDGSHRITYGNDLGLNPSSASDLANDKGHAKFMLRNIGVNCPEGQEFLLPWWAEQIGASQKARGNTNIQTTHEALAYIKNTIGYPAYIKPVSGSKGLGVHKVENLFDAQDVFHEYEESRVRVAVVEEAIQMPDYRVVMLDGALISAYKRNPLQVRGDGENSVETLVGQLQEKYFDEGRDTIINLSDPRILQTLGKHGLTLASILENGQNLVLTSVSNLSAGGTALDVSNEINEHWVAQGAYIAENFNLRLCGIDLACSDITVATSNYSVLEVNATPGLDHYASSGAAQQKVVDELYRKVLNTYPSTAQ